MRLVLLLLVFASLANAQMVPQIMQQHLMDKPTRVEFHKAIAAQINTHFQEELKVRPDPNDRAGALPSPILEIELRDEGSNRWTLSARAWMERPPAGTFFIGQGKCETKGDVIDFIERVFPSGVPGMKKLLAEAE